MSDNNEKIDQSDAAKKDRIAYISKLQKARIERRQEEKRQVKQGVICGFIIAWHGYCAKKAVDEDGRCELHSNMKCTNCDNLATAECDYDCGLVCGYPICNSCEHPHGHKK